MAIMHAQLECKVQKARAHTVKLKINTPLARTHAQNDNLPPMNPFSSIRVFFCGTKDYL